LGLSYQDTLTMPEGEVMALLLAHEEIVSPKKKKTYVVKRKKPSNGR